MTPGRSLSGKAIGRSVAGSMLKPSLAATPRAVGAASTVVFVCVTGSPDVEAVVRDYYNIAPGQDNFEYLGSTEHRRWQDWHPNDRHSAPANPVDPDLLKTG